MNLPRSWNLAGGVWLDDEPPHEALEPVRGAVPRDCTCGRYLGESGECLRHGDVLELRHGTDACGAIRARVDESMQAAGLKCRRCGGATPKAIVLCDSMRPKRDRSGDTVCMCPTASDDWHARTERRACSRCWEWEDECRCNRRVEAAVGPVADSSENGPSGQSGRDAGRAGGRPATLEIGDVIESRPLGHIGRVVRLDGTRVHYQTGAPGQRQAHRSTLVAHAGLVRRATCSPDCDLREHGHVASCPNFTLTNPREAGLPTGDGEPSAAGPQPEAARTGRACAVDARDGAEGGPVLACGTVAQVGMRVVVLTRPLDQLGPAPGTETTILSVDPSCATCRGFGASGRAYQSYDRLAAIHDTTTTPKPGQRYRSRAHGMPWGGPYRWDEGSSWAGGVDWHGVPEGVEL